MSRLSCTGASALGAALALAAACGAYAAEPEPSELSNQIVVRDAVSGHLRAASRDEAIALQPRLRSNARPGAVSGRMPEKLHISGARGSRLPEEYLSYSVVVRGTDGRLMELCFQSREAAEAALTDAPVSRAGANLPTE